MTTAFQFCPQCATPLARITLAEDGGDKERLRCPACAYTHWNNPTPVLAAIVEYEGQILLARNAAWPGKMYALITGFMEAGETPQDVKCWPAGTGYAMADFLRARGHEPVFIDPVWRQDAEKLSP